MTLSARETGALLRQYFSALTDYFNSTEGRVRQLHNPHLRSLAVSLSRSLAGEEMRAAFAGNAPAALLETLYARCITLLTLYGVSGVIPAGMESVRVAAAAVSCKST
jgi:hypothetical protein